MINLEKFAVFSLVSLILIFENFSFTHCLQENNRQKRFDSNDDSLTVTLEPDEDMSPGIYYLLISTFHLISDSLVQQYFILNFTDFVN
jgi:hypothetical protein